MTGELAPGQRLTVGEVAAELGTSPMPVREAFQRLTSDGALEMLSSGATRVPILDAATAQRITKVRLAVESLAVRRAATRLDPDDVDELRQLYDDVVRTTRAGDAAGVTAANDQFHFAVYRAARSVELTRIIRHVWLQLGPHLYASIKADLVARQSIWPRVLVHQKALLLALERRDPDAADAAIRADVTLTGRVLEEHARTSREPKPAGAARATRVPRGSPRNPP
jgi:DNA-binding GntR family transcriptional regulator